MRKSKNRYFYHIFVYPGDTPGAITLNVVRMEREFDAYKLSRSMCPSMFNSFPVIRTASAQNRCSHVPQPTYLFSLETPLRLSRNVLHGWKDNWILVKPLSACTHLCSTVSQLFEPQVQKIAVMTVMSPAVTGKLSWHVGAWCQLWPGH